jgi:hypothetical protein
LRTPRGRRVIAIGSTEYERLVAQPGAPAVDSAPDAVAWLFYTRYVSVLVGKVAWTRASIYKAPGGADPNAFCRRLAENIMLAMLNRKKLHQRQ